MMKGYLLLHGFAGSPEDLAPIAQLIKNDGGLLRCPALTLQGNKKIQVKSGDWEDWVASAESSLMQLQDVCTQVHVIGFSMGSLISVYLTSRYKVDRLVLMSPPMNANPQEFVKGMAQSLKDQLKRASSSTSTPYLKELIRRASRFQLGYLTQFHELIDEVKPLLEKVTAPTLILHGEKDDFAHPNGARYIYQQLGSSEKKLVYLPKSRHLLCKDQEVDQVITEVEDFLGLHS